MVKPDAKAYAQKRKTFQKQVSCNTEHEFIILQNHSEKKVNSLSIKYTVF